MTLFVCIRILFKKNILLILHIKKLTHDLKGLVAFNLTIQTLSLIIMTILSISDFALILEWANVPLIRFSEVFKVVRSILIAPFIEEFVFRYLIMTVFLGKYQRKTAAVISALLFALLHPLYLFPFSLVVGLVLSAMYYKYKNIFYNITTHAMINAINHACRLVLSIGYLSFLVSVDPVNRFVGQTFLLSGLGLVLLFLIFYTYKYLKGVFKYTDWTSLANLENEQSVES